MSLSHKQPNKFERNVILLSYSVGWGSLTPTIIGYYKNILSHTDLAYRLITDNDILVKEKYLYKQLISINHDRLRGHERLGKLSKDIKSGLIIDLKLSDIVRLYTERLDPWAIIDDINSIEGYKTYQLCYEDEETWERIMKTHFDECQGWVEEPLSPSEDSSIYFFGSPPSPLTSPPSPLTSLPSPLASSLETDKSLKEQVAIASSWHALEMENFHRENNTISRKQQNCTQQRATTEATTLTDHVARLGCSRKDLLSMQLRRKRFQGGHLSTTVTISVNLSNRIDSPLNAPREDDQGLDYDHEDQDGNPITVIKSTIAEEKKLKIKLDLELDQLSKRDYCEESNSSSKD